MRAPEQFENPMTEHPLESLAWLSRIRDCLRDGLRITEDDRIAIISSLTDYLDGRATDMDEAFGLRGGPGQHDPRTHVIQRQRLDTRDNYLRKAAEQSGKSPAELAKLFHRYRTGSWDRD